MRIILLVCGLFLCSHALAQALFIDSSRPPNGFQLHTNTQHLHISVNFMGQYVGLFYVSLSQGQLKFDSPSQLLSKLDDVNKNEKIRRLLSQNFPLNIECYTNTMATLPGYCEKLKREPIYIIYEPQQEMVYLYLASYLFENPKDQDAIDFIPYPTSGMSYINKLGAAGSFSSHQPFYSRLYPTTPNYYNLYSNNIVAYANNSLVGNLSQNNGINNGQHFQIQSLYAQRIVEDKIYSSGYIANAISPFFQTQTILGVSVRTTLDTVKNADNVLATPLIIFVPEAGQVNIFKNEQLIFSQYLPAGYQRINTSGFPDGAYELTIKIGTNNAMNHFFTKGSSLPPGDAPQFYVTTGYLTNGMILYQNTYDFLPSTRDSVFQTGLNKRISERIALSTDFLFNSSQKFLDVGPTFLLGHVFVKTAGLIGSKNNYGAYIMLSLQQNRMNINMIATKITYQNKRPNYYFLNNLIDNDSISVGYQLSDYDLFSVQGNYNNSLSQPKSYSAGVFYQRQLINYNGTALFFNATYNKTAYVGNTYSLGLSVNFGRDQIAGTESLLWQNQRNSAPGNKAAIPLVESGSTVYSKQNEEGIGSSFNEIHSLSSTVSSIAGTYNYTARPGFIATYLNHNQIKEMGNSMGYGGNVETEFAMNSKGARLNGLNRGNTSGIIIQVDAGNMGDISSKFALLDQNNRKIAVLSANKKLFISLPAYTDQNYTLINLSKSDYFIKEPIRHVTLYPGNVDYYSWQVEKRIIVIGRVLSKYQGHPLANIWIHAGDNGIFSDDEGNFQLELTQNTTTLTAGDACQIILPKLNINKIYLSIGDVACA